MVPNGGMGTWAVEPVETESIVVDEGVSAGACWALSDSARCTAVSILDIGGTGVERCIACLPLHLD
jgi:hypothetical protein